MKIKFLGQNCFLFTYKGKNILSDPFYNYKKEASGFNIEAQVIDYILLTHAHGDHTADVKEVLQHYPEVTIIAQPEICSYFNHHSSIDLNFGGTVEIEDLKISMVPTSHTSSFPDGTYGGEPAGYIFRFPNAKNLYLAGDTGASIEMSWLPKLYGNLDWCILPIGGHYTMCPQTAAFVASEFLKTSKVIGCHFDTFPAIEINHQRSRQVFLDKGIDLVLPRLGEVLEF